MHLCKLLLQTGENVTETFRMLTVAFGEQTVGRTQVLSGCPSLKSVWPLLKKLNAWEFIDEQNMKI